MIVAANRNMTWQLEVLPTVGARLAWQRTRPTQPPRDKTVGCQTPYDWRFTGNRYIIWRYVPRLPHAGPTAI